MNLQISLLDFLAAKMGCSCISDLLNLDSVSRRSLAYRLGCIPIRETDLRDWQDAHIYLTGAQPPSDDPQEIRQAIIRHLSR